MSFRHIYSLRYWFVNFTIYIYIYILMGIISIQKSMIIDYEFKFIY
jgi:hypothetical protein